MSSGRTPFTPRPTSGEPDARDRHEMLVPTILFRAFCLLATIAVLAVLTTSAVSLDLWFVDGIAADILTGLYAGGLAASAVRPRMLALHLFTASAGTLFWAGRGQGFAEMVFDGRTDLVGAVSERAHSGGAALIIHLMFLVASQMARHIESLRHELAVCRAERDA